MYICALSFCVFQHALGKPQKKSSSTNGRAIKRGGGKGRAIKEKKLFLKLFFILLPFKNLNYFTLDNLSKYGNITLKFVGRYLYLLVTTFSKKQDYFSPKIEGRKKVVKIRFRLFYEKKKFRWPLRGGGEGLNGLAISGGTFFCGFPNAC